MRSIPTKQIDGDVAVGRNVAAGGNANVQGSVRIGHNLVVEGILDAKNIKGPFKGLYETKAQLEETYPNPRNGWWALVGLPLPAPVYLAYKGQWKVKTGSDGSPVVAGEIVVDLSGIMGKAYGIAPLDEDGKVPDKHIPERYDDVVAFADTVSGITVNATEPTNYIQSSLIVFNKDTGKFVYAMQLLEVDNGQPVESVWTQNSDGTKSLDTSHFKFFAQWLGSELYGTVATGGITPEAGKIYVEAATERLYIYNGSTLSCATRLLGHNSGEAFPGDEGAALDDKVSHKIGILPFDGIWYGSGTAPTSGVYYCPNDADGAHFRSFGTDDRFHGWADEDYNIDTTANPDRLYRLEGKLYHFVDGELREFVSSERTFTVWNEFELDTATSKWSVGGDATEFLAGVKAGDILNTTGTAVSTYVVVSIVRSAGAVTQVGVVKLGEAVTVYALKADTTYKKVALVDETALKAATPSYWKVDARDYGFGNPGNGNWTAYRQGSSEEADIFGDCRVGDIVELESMDDTVNAVIVSKHESVITLCAQTAGPQSSYTHLLYNIWDDGTIDAFIPQEKLKATDDVTVDGGISITDSARRQVFSDLWKDAVGMVDYKDHPTKPYEHDGAWFTYDEARAEFNKIKFPRSHALTLALGDNSEGTWSGAALTDIRQGDVLTWTDANDVNQTASVITGYTTDSAGYACALFANDGDIYIEFNLLWLLSNGNAYAVAFSADSVVWHEMAKLQKRLADTDDITVEAETEAAYGLYLKDSAKRAVFIDRWNARCVDMYGNKCGGYNEATGYFELNGLTDITYAQAMEIMSSASYWCRAPIGSMPSMSLLNIRTAFPFGGYGNSLGGVALNSTFKNCEKLEVVVVQSGNFTPLNGTFLGCKKLRKVVLNTEYSTSFDNAAFYQCYALEELSVQAQILSNINLSPCSRLSVASASNITAKGKSGITVTVHADVFAKLTGDMTNEAAAALTDDEKAAWAAVLEAACAKNISFAAA
nr:MAG TPA: leucine-rich repeat protein [Caudoviricetes sp.]